MRNDLLSPSPSDLFFSQKGYCNLEGMIPSERVQLAKERKPVGVLGRTAISSVDGPVRRRLTEGDRSVRYARSGEEEVAH